MSHNSIGTVMRNEKNISKNVANVLIIMNLIRCFPYKLTTKDIFKLPNYEYIHNELKRINIMLTSLFYENISG